MKRPRRLHKISADLLNSAIYPEGWYSMRMDPADCFVVMKKVLSDYHQAKSVTLIAEHLIKTPIIMTVSLMSSAAITNGRSPYSLPRPTQKSLGMQVHIRRQYCNALR